jgi:hypothetical protein
MKACDRDSLCSIKVRATRCPRKSDFHLERDLGFPLPARASDRIFRKVVSDRSVQVSQLQPERSTSQAAGGGNHDHTAMLPSAAEKKIRKKRM